MDSVLQNRLFLIGTRPFYLKNNNGALPKTTCQINVIAVKVKYKYQRTNRFTLLRLGLKPTDSKINA